MTLPTAPDVLVVGGGVIGCAVARLLAAPERAVLLVDRGAIGGEASSAAAGLLAVASGEDEDERLALRRESAARFPALVTALAEETGVEVAFERVGVIALAFEPEAERRLAARAARRRAQGFAAEGLDAGAVRALEPLAGPRALGGALFADDAQIDAGALARALADAARRRSAVVVPGTPVTAFERAHGRVTRVRVGGDWIAPRTVVVAAGAWSGELPGLDLGMRVVPVRGQMLALRPARRVCAHVLTDGEGFLLPRRDGELWVGATFEEAGFAKAVTAGGVERLLVHLARLAPDALGATLLRAWAGLRPMLRGGGPLIARARDADNVVVATGHHRNGILLAPITAEVVAALVESRPVPEVARPFGAGG